MLALTLNILPLVTKKPVSIVIFKTKYSILKQVHKIPAYLAYYKRILSLRFNFLQLLIHALHAYFLTLMSQC